MNKRLVLAAPLPEMMLAASVHRARADDRLKAALGDLFCYQQHWAGEEYTTPKIRVLRGTMHRAGGITRLYFDGYLFDRPFNSGTSEIAISKVREGVVGVFSWEWVPPANTTEWPRLRDMLASGSAFMVDLSSYKCQQKALTDPVYGPILIKALVAEAHVGGVPPVGTRRI